MEDIKTSKICIRCEQVKPLSYFHNDKRRPDGVGAICKNCQKIHNKNYYQLHKDDYKKRILKNVYGISLEDFRRMLVRQRGVCAICGRPETATINGNLISLSVDHNHKNQQVRGLLCVDCNSLIAHAKEEIYVLQNAIQYLLSYSSITNEKVT